MTQHTTRNRATDPPPSTATPTERLFTAVAARGPAATALVTRAHVVAGAAHHGRFRYSGEPYITHPVAVAAGVAELGADLTTILAALLHGVSEDTAYATEDLRAEFGDPVCELLAAFGRIRHGDDVDDLSDVDPRVALLEIAHRLHTMQTIEYVNRSAQRRKALHTRQMIAPLARSLGHSGVAAELDTIATRTLDRAGTRHESAHERSAVPTAGVRAARGVLHALARVLLPGPSCDRWLTEWDGELHTLPSPRRRLAFIADLLLALPALAVRSRHLDEGDEP